MNIFFDAWLIFGRLGIEPMGVAGTAIGTGLAQLAQTLFLLAMALTPSMRAHYNTHCYKEHIDSLKALLKEFLTLGLPLGLGQAIELLGQVTFLRLTEKMGSEQLLLTSLAQSLFLLLMFVAMSTNKTAATICANAVGSRQPEVFSIAIRNCMKLIAACSLIVFIAINLKVTWILQGFLNAEDFLLITQNPQLMQTARLTLLGLSIFFFFDNTNWTMHGVLTAKSDTRIVMAVNTVAYWGLVIAPLAGMVYFGFKGAYLGWFLLAASSFCSTGYYLLRHQRRPLVLKPLETQELS